MQSRNEHYFHVVAEGRRLECRAIGDPGSRPGALVFLHEGLGSLSDWRDFPDRVCAATGLPGLVYSRAGYGRSDPIVEPRTARFMHDEAIRVLPVLLRELHIERPILVGHSDGASIALIHAGTFPDAAAAVVVLAPHLFVEPVCIEAIAEVAHRYETPGLRERLARHHADVDGAFRYWTEVWLSDAFASWTIEKEVAAIRCPILAVQGESDQYGTMRQLDRIAELQPAARLLKLPDCGHRLHRDRPDEVAAAIASFCREVAGTQACPGVPGG
ncbi:MAG TPA: alpha/beta hydrolase [Zeimonas sp.]